MSILLLMELSFILTTLQICQNNEVTEVKLVYAIFNNREMLVGNRQMGPVPIINDNYSITHDKAKFGIKHVLK